MLAQLLFKRLTMMALIHSIGQVLRGKSIASKIGFPNGEGIRSKGIWSLQNLRDLIESEFHQWTLVLSIVISYVFVLYLSQVICTASLWATTILSGPQPDRLCSMKFMFRATARFYIVSQLRISNSEAMCCPWAWQEALLDRLYKEMLCVWSAGRSTLAASCSHRLLPLLSSSARTMNESSEAAEQPWVYSWHASRATLEFRSVYSAVKLLRGEQL